MTVRIAGIVILIFSAGFYSATQIKKEKQKISQLEDMCGLILYIYRNIETFMTPVNDILKSYEDYGKALSEYIETAKKFGLSYAAEHCPLLWENDIAKIFREFSKKIGTGYKEEELSFCKYCHTQLSEVLCEKNSDFSS